MDNLTLTTAPVASSQLSSLVNAIAHVCNALVDAFEIGFDKVSSYGIKSIQHVFTGVKTLFVDVIILGLRQIEIMIKELKKY